MFGWDKVIAGAALVVTLSVASASAASDNWSGFYAGAHIGYSRGTSQTTATVDGATAAGSGSFGTAIGGLQAGYNVMILPRWLLGVESDISFPNSLSADDVIWSRTSNQSDLAGQLDYTATLRARLGYTAGDWLLYGTGGFALAAGRFTHQPDGAGNTEKLLHLYPGWTWGFGVETPVLDAWSVRFEYLYQAFGAASVNFASGTTATSSFSSHTLRLGLNYNFDIGRQEKRAFGGIETPAWELHGQTTFIAQGYPGFSAPYSGTNSFTPWAQARETLTASLFLGLRPWDGGEIYYNPELLQGFGLNATTGAAGFPNGEAQKSNFPYPHYSTSRLFLRQTFGLGGEQETVESSYGQMGGKRDINRISVQVGKFAVHDVFDNNTYAQDPRTDFQNWSVWAAGAFDYPADKVGLGYGAVAEYNQKDWALRAGYFLVGSVPNGNEFDTHIFRRGAYIGEWERRYTIVSQPGKLRIGIWANTYLSGSYAAANDLVAANPLMDATAAILSTRAPRTKYGYYLNVEQALYDGIGVFGRWSCNDGRTEISAFTDIDWSASGGVAIQGQYWGRPDDKLGLATAVNGLSANHRQYLANGGLGILVGDGRLNYSPEQILESFYTVSLARRLSTSLDYQLIRNPGHNADRGPVSVFSVRLHAEF